MDKEEQSKAQRRVGDVTSFLNLLRLEDIYHPKPIPRSRDEVHPLLIFPFSVVKSRPNLVMEFPSYVFVDLKNVKFPM